MDRTHTTTDEQDAALVFEAARQGKTDQELFDIIVDADMGTLVRNTAQVKAALITPDQQAILDKINSLTADQQAAILANVDDVIASNVIIIKPGPPIKVL